MGRPPWAESAPPNTGQVPNKEVQPLATPGSAHSLRPQNNF